MVNGQSPKNLSLEIVNGISIVNSDFSDLVKDGFNNEISISKNFCDKLSLGMGVKHSSFNVKQEFGQTSGSRNQFRSIGFDLGPQFSFGSDRFSIKLYGRTGLAINSTPELISRYPSSDIVTSNLKQQSLNALTARLGVKLNTELCKGIQLFVSSEYLTSLNGDISYQSKDISKAIRADGSIDPDLASEIPSTSTSFNFSSINVNFGVSIAIGKLGNHPNRRSSNPLYQDKGNKAVNPMYQPRSSSNSNPLHQESGNQGSNILYEGANNSGSNSGQNSGTRAQDYNSSRSNTTTAAQLDNKDENKPISTATDYNSSRSNKADGAIENPNGGNTSGTRAQDYNSSRSNTTTAIELDNQDEKDEIDPISTATDYNSSRSNKADGAIENPNGGNTSGTRAQDYNSSRSNTTTAIELDDQDEKEEIDPISTATDYNSSRSNKADGVIENPNGGNNSGTRAQDYNSSRSNTTTAIELDNQDEKEEIDPISTATDYNSSRSNKADGAIENPNGGNTSGTRAQDYNSSRSNTTTSIELDNQDEKEEIDPISTATDYNSSRSNKADGAIENPNGGNTSGTRAQDYNSSRSNRGIAAPNDDIRVSMSRADKKKMKRKLKREKKQRLKEERRKRKSQANSIY